MPNEIEIIVNNNTYIIRDFPDENCETMDSWLDLIKEQKLILINFSLPHFKLMEEIKACVRLIYINEFDIKNRFGSGDYDWNILYKNKKDIKKIQKDIYQQFITHFYEVTVKTGIIFENRNVKISNLVFCYKYTFKQNPDIIKQIVKKDFLKINTDPSHFLIDIKVKQVSKKFKNYLKNVETSYL